MNHRARTAIDEYMWMWVKKQLKHHEYTDKEWFERHRVAQRRLQRRVTPIFERNCPDDKENV